MKSSQPTSRTSGVVHVFTVTVALHAIRTLCRASFKLEKVSLVVIS